MLFFLWNYICSSIYSLIFYSSFSNKFSSYTFSRTCISSPFIANSASIFICSISYGFLSLNSSLTLNYCISSLEKEKYGVYAPVERVLEFWRWDQLSFAIIPKSPAKTYFELLTISPLLKENYCSWIFSSIFSMLKAIMMVSGAS